MEFKFETPISKENTSKLNIGDIVYITGDIFTARDQAHKRIIEEDAPYNIVDSVIFHAGPIIQLNDRDMDNFDADMIAVGPTTSMRMNPFEPQVLDKGVNVIIGKGGMDDNTENALVKNSAVYLAAPGGCAALIVKSVKNVVSVEWLDLGVPEAIWHLKVENFGPLIVAMDAHGNNLYKSI